MSNVLSRLLLKASGVAVRPLQLIVGSGLSLVDNKNGTATLAAGAPSVTALTATIANTTGSSIPAYTAVMWQDTASSGAPEVWVPGATDTNTVQNALFGVTTASIADGATGSVVTWGLLTGVDTSGMLLGDDVHVATAGALAAGDGNLWVGLVLVAAVNGTIFVAGTKASDMGHVMAHSHNDVRNGDTLNVPAFDEIAAASVPTPPSGEQRLFIDIADHALKRKDSSGTVTIIG